MPFFEPFKISENATNVYRSIVGAPDRTKLSEVVEAAWPYLLLGVLTYRTSCSFQASMWQRRVAACAAVTSAMAAIQIIDHERRLKGRFQTLKEGLIGENFSIIAFGRQNVWMLSAVATLEWVAIQVEAPRLVADITALLVMLTWAAGQRELKRQEIELSKQEHLDFELNSITSSLPSDFLTAKLSEEETDHPQTLLIGHLFSMVRWVAEAKDKKPDDTRIKEATAKLVEYTLLLLSRKGDIEEEREEEEPLSSEVKLAAINVDELPRPLQQLVQAVHTHLLDEAGPSQLPLGVAPAELEWNGQRFASLDPDTYSETPDQHHLMHALAAASRQDEETLRTLLTSSLVDEPIAWWQSYTILQACAFLRHHPLSNLLHWNAEPLFEKIYGLERKTFLAKASAIHAVKPGKRRALLLDLLKDKGVDESIVGEFLTNVRPTFFMSHWLPILEKLYCGDEAICKYAASEEGRQFYLKMANDGHLEADLCFTLLSSQGYHIVVHCDLLQEVQEFAPPMGTDTQQTLHLYYETQDSRYVALQLIEAEETSDELASTL